MSWGRRLLVACVSVLVRLWLATLRVDRRGPALAGPGVVAFWHGDQLPLLAARPRGDVVAPISLSRDGDLQAALLGRLGIAAVRGSTSRNALAVARGLRRALGNGALALVAVDGPRGPARLASAGAPWLAQVAGAPLWPVGVAVRHGRRLRRPWDRYLLPLPLTRVVVWVGEPLTAGADAQVLTDALWSASTEARALLNRSAPTRHRSVAS